MMCAGEKQREHMSVQIEQGQSFNSQNKRQLVGCTDLLSHRISQGFELVLRLLKFGKHCYLPQLYDDVNLSLGAELQAPARAFHKLSKVVDSASIITQEETQWYCNLPLLI